MLDARNSTLAANFVVTLDNPSFCAFLVCSCLLVLKVMGVTLLTIFLRFKNKMETTNFPVSITYLLAFICPEDAKWLKGDIVVNDSVERTRRAHLNDLENIPFFIVAAFAYLWVQPPHCVSIVLFFAYTILRTLHTIVYTLIILPQPTRALLWLGGYLITGYMAIHTALYAFIYLVS